MRLTGQRNKCPTCGKYFNSNAAFSKHRIGDFGKNRRCMADYEMTGAGMVVNKKGFWVTALSGDYFKFIERKIK